MTCLAPEEANGVADEDDAVDDHGATAPEEGKTAVLEEGQAVGGTRSAKGPARASARVLVPGGTNADADLGGAAPEEGEAVADEGGAVGLGRIANGPARASASVPEEVAVPEVRSAALDEA
eukprot:14296472-Alexandrium_andersonii.AAC.1